VLRYAVRIFFDKFWALLCTQGFLSTWKKESTGLCQIWKTISVLKEADCLTLTAGCRMIKKFHPTKNEQAGANPHVTRAFSVPSQSVKTIKKGKSSAKHKAQQRFDH